SIGHWYPRERKCPSEHRSRPFEALESLQALRRKRPQRLLHQHLPRYHPSPRRHPTNGAHRRPRGKRRRCCTSTSRASMAQVLVALLRARTSSERRPEGEQGGRDGKGGKGRGGCARRLAPR